MNAVRIFSRGCATLFGSARINPASPRVISSHKPNKNLNISQTRLLRVTRSVLTHDDICNRVTIRRATSDDYNDIVEISRSMYWDFVPAYYHEWLKDESRIMYVGDIEDASTNSRPSSSSSSRRVIVTVIVHVVDGGRTIVAKAARVHPNYRGRGIFTKIELHMRQDARVEFPSLTRELVRTELVFASLFSTTRQWWPVIVYHTDSRVQAMKEILGSEREGRFLWSEYGVDVQYFETSDAQKLLKRASNIDSIFQDGIYVIGLEIFDVKEEKNFPLMFKDGDAIFALTSSEDNSHLSSFSHGTCVQSNIGNVWAASIFVDKENSEDARRNEMLAHLRAQLIACCKCSDDMSLIEVSFSGTDAVIPDAHEMLSNQLKLARHVYIPEGIFVKEHNFL